MLALAGVLFYGAFQIRVLPSYAHIGPRFFPLLVATGAAACGFILLVQALLKSGRSADESADTAEAASPLDWPAMLMTVAALVIQVFLFERAGFIIASGIMFTGVAAAFGSRQHVRNALIGLVLSFVAYWAFTRWLGLHLPAGILRPILMRLGGA